MRTGDLEDHGARRVLFPDTVITGELLERLRLAPEVARSELVDGTLYAMPPQTRWHGEMLMHLGGLLRPPPGWRLLAGGVGIQLRPDTVRGPDLMVLSDGRYARTDPARAFLTVLPELLIEITSPAHDVEDASGKVRDYLAAGALADVWPLVWVVDLDTRRVTQWSRAGHTVHGDAPLTLPWGDTLAAEKIFRRNGVDSRRGRTR